MQCVIKAVLGRLSLGRVSGDLLSCLICMALELGSLDVSLPLPHFGPGSLPEGSHAKIHPSKRV